MPDNNGSGPGVNSTGPRDGRGKGQGYHTNDKGSGSKTGGDKGDCE